MSSDNKSSYSFRNHQDYLHHPESLMGSLSLRASLQTYWYQFLKRDLLPQHFSCMSVCKLRVAQWNPWGYWGEMVFVFWWPQYCCGLLLRQPLLSSRWLEQHDPVMLRKEDMILISLCKHMVRFLKPANQIYFWCTFTGPVLGEGNKWIWPKGWHLSPTNHGRGSSSTGFHFTPGLESQLYKGITQS